MMEKYKDYVVSWTKLPSYLAELLQHEENIVLVHCKRGSSEVQSMPIQSLSFSINSTLNLTGCPLEVDLSVLPDVYDAYANWNAEEAHHIPMSLKLARKFINEYNKTSSKSVYCVCDGGDPNHVVVLGSRMYQGSMVRTLVFTEGCVDKIDLQNNIDGMRQKHIENIGILPSKIETKVTCLYEVYGHKLKSQHISEDLETTGSILVEGTWNSPQFDIPHNRVTVKMLLQSVVGHTKSIMYPFFEELKFLHHCISLLSHKTDALDDSVISFNSQDTCDLNKRICEIFHETNVIRKLSIAPKTLQDAILNREEITFLDKLWGILKCCKKVSDLRSCFTVLFERINNSLKVQIFDVDKDVVLGKMISDIYTGRMIVPYLSAKQLLEVLIDLGIQKIKNSYFFIVKSFDLTIGEQLLNSWKKVGSSSIESRRGTFAELNLTQGFAQLQFLFYTHVLLEFRQLVELNFTFPPHVSLSVVKHAFNKYLTEKSLMKAFSIMEIDQLFELVVPLTSEDTKLIEDCSFLKWKIEMTSTDRDSSVTTIFHYSKKPIFPDVIYKYNVDADMSSGIIGEKFFVSRLECYSDKIFS